MNDFDRKLKALGDRIRCVRRLKGLTQAEAAIATGLDVRYYNRLEMGKTNPTFITLDKVATGLDVTIVDVRERANDRKLAKQREGSARKPATLKQK